MQDKNDSSTPWQHSVSVRDLRASKSYPVEISPSAEVREAIANHLGIISVKKLRLAGEIRSSGKSDWMFSGQLGASVVQSCVVTLEPVTTRLDEPVLRHYLANWQINDVETETEMPEDDNIEPLGEQIELGDTMVEALALALPIYPRSQDAMLEVSTFTEPGKEAMTDEQAKPFAGLAELKKQMQNKGK